MKGLHQDCQAALLQALWQWLWSGKHKIEKEDGAPLLTMFRKLGYSDTENAFNEADKQLKNHALYKKDHIEQDVLPRKDINGHSYTE